MPRPTLIAVLLSLTCLPVRAGNITGELRNARGERTPNAPSCCSIYGSNPTGVNSGILRTSNEANGYGVFYWPNLDQGTYSQGFAESGAYGVMYRKGISVPVSGDATWTVLQHNPGVFAHGNYWRTPWNTWVAQSFRATGTSVCSVSVRCAGVSNNAGVEVAVLDGDNPSAPQIGPTRVIPYDSTWNMTPRAAYWSAGEVPTVPGQVYTLRVRPTNHASGGQFAPFYQTVRNKLRADIPDGQTWYDGVLSNQPLETVITSDDQGFIHTMCCARPDGYEWIGAYAGQTFVSRGSSVVAVTWSSNSDAQFAVSVHSNSPSGAQVGITKYIRGSFSWDNRSMVTFAPGEVPTTPGAVYCVKIRRTDGQGFALDKAGASSVYSGGQAYTEQTPRNYDFAVGIYQEKFAGALDQSAVSISNMRVDTITTNSAVVRWVTSPSADSTVHYGEDTPYTDTVHNSAVSPFHAITLSGLKANTMYHVRAISRASTGREGVSKDLVFTTAPATANLLSNPGFETGSLSGWTAYGRAERRVTGSWLGGSGPHTGSYGFAGAASGGLVQGGVYQRVAAIPGHEYRLTGWFYTYCDGNLWSSGQCTVGMLGLDPAGGTNPGHVVNPGVDDRWIPNAAVKWTPPSLSQDGGPDILYGYLYGAWTSAGISVLASSNYVTAFAYGGNDANTTWSVFSFDDFVLTDVAPTPSTAAEVVGQRSDGALVSVSGLVVTDASEPGVYYAQHDTRICGLRIETGGGLSPGDRITVSGYVGSKPSGERYLGSAVVTARASGSQPAPLSARLSSVGGSGMSPLAPSVPGTDGPYNVGMLFRCSGEVTAVGVGCFYVNDGSLPGNGLKVDTRALSAPPVGAFVGVTGTVRLEGSAGAATVLLHPRSSADLRVYAL